MSNIELSIVIPVYNVQGYLRQCLESVVSQYLDNYEVVVVNDASTDGSLRIIEEFEQRYSNIRCINLKENKGLGNARNVGIDAAQGEYIAFVDSDDYLEPGGLSKALSVAGAYACDVVLMNHSRVWWWGKRSVNIMTPLLEELAPVVDGEENKARLFENLIVAWNKIYRASFIRANSLRNGDGYYEDIPWSYPVLMLAGRVGIVTDVCYAYRQREGSILSSGDPRHLGLPARYDEVIGIAGSALAASPVYRAKLLERILDHYLVMLFRHVHRIPRESVSEFFALCSAQLNRHFSRDEILDVQARMGLNKRHIALLISGNVSAFRLFMRLRQTVINLNKNKSALDKTVNRYRNRIKLYLYRNLFDKMAIDEKKIVFSSMFGDQYSCNPKYISEALARIDPSFKIYWEVNKQDFDAPGYVRKIRRNTIEYYYHMGTAKFFVNNVNFPDFLRKRNGTVHIQTQHGTPLKTMGLDLIGGYPAAHNMTGGALRWRSSRWDYCLSSNAYSSEIWARCFPYMYTMVECGYPRNDIFFNHDNALTAQLKRELQIPGDKKVIMYVPTHREYTKDFRSSLDIDVLAKALGDEYVFLVRVHHFHRGHRSSGGGGAKFMVDVADYPDVQHLMLITDILITDYSSVMFDFAVLERPIINLIDDFEIYEKVRGMYFDIRKEPPGVVAYSTQDLVRAIVNREYEEPECVARLKLFRKKFCAFETGKAAENVVRKLIVGNLD